MKMPILFIATSFAFFASSAFADINAQGAASLSSFNAYPREASVALTGPAAKVLWSQMTEVPIRPASQFQPNDMKIGRGLTCEKAVRDDILGLKRGDIVCEIAIKDLPTGEI